MCHNCIAEHDDPTTKMGDSIQLNGYNTLVTEYVCVCLLWKSIEPFGWQFNCLHFNCSTDCKNTLTHRHTKERKSASAFHSRLCHGLLPLLYTTYKLSTVCLLVFMPRYTNFRFHVAHLQIDSQINHWKLVALFVLSCVCVCIYFSVARPFRHCLSSQSPSSSF